MNQKSILLFWILLWSLQAAATPIFYNVAFPPTVGKYQKFETNFDLNAYQNPYDFDEIDVWAEFTSPSGKPTKVYAFYYNGYTKLDDGAPTTNEVLATSGEQGWKIRFSPNETGTWTFKILAHDLDGTVSEPMTDHHSFSVTASAEKGFISLANTRYLKYDSGDPYYPIGDSYPWWLVSPWRAGSNGKEKGTNIMNHYLDGMADNGFTYNRFEINFFEGLSLIGRDYVLQKTFNNYYNQHDAWQMDQIMEYAKQKGINFNVALFSGATLGDDGEFRYLGPDDLDGIPDIIPDTNSHGQSVPGISYGNWSVFHPYNVNQDIRYRPLLPDRVGDCVTYYDFFTKPSAILAQKKLFRYVVARWGYCTNLMGFELVDEVHVGAKVSYNDLNPHYAPRPSNWTSLMGIWHKTMYDYIKSVDPNKHLISSPAVEPEIFEVISPLMDFINIHWYTDYRYADADGLFQPFEYTIADWLETHHQTYQKPTAIMETAWWAEQISEDPRLYELHNLIWSGLVNGSMGLTAMWAHDGIVDRGALNQFLGVGTYAKLLPLFNEQHLPNRVVKDGLKWQFISNNFYDEIFGWVQDDNFTFWSLWNGRTNAKYMRTFNPADRPPLSSTIYTHDFPIGRDGSYRINWYDTQTGLLHSSEKLTSSKGTIAVTMPEDLRNSTWADAAFTLKFEEGNPAMLVYPNPHNSNFTVYVKNEDISNCRYTVYSASGTEILKGTTELSKEAPSFHLDLSNFANGVYFLTVSMGIHRFSERLVKQ